MINLKTSHDVFRTTDFNFTLNGLIKRIRLNDPTMDVVVIGNFNVNSGAVNPAFQSTGMWYEFFTGDSLMVTNVTDQITLQPAEYRLYTSQPLNTPSITNTRIYKDETLNASIFPNPAKDFVNVAFELTTGSDVQMTIYNWNGQLIKQVSNEYLPSGEQQIQVDVNDLPFGNYILQIQTATEQVALPIIKF